MKYYATGYRTQTGWRSALVAEGTARLHIVTMQDTGLTVEHAPLDRARYFTALTYKGAPYPLKRAVRHYRAHAKRHGATKGALAILKAAVEAGGEP